MTRIPLDPNGYKVDGQTIHTRYADHSNGQRTRTTKGVETLLGGKEGKPCIQCYGKAPRYPEAPRPPQRRRSPLKELDNWGESTAAGISSGSTPAARRSQKNGDG